MRKNIFLIVLLLGFSYPMLAQTVSIGVKAGTHFADVSQSDEDFEIDVTKNRLGVQAAGIVEIGFSDLFALQLEPGFVTKGFKMESDYDMVDGRMETKINFGLNYLELPILAKVRTGGEQFTFFANAGPSVGYALNGKVKTDMKYYNNDTGQTVEEKDEEKIDFKEDEVNRLDFGLNFGAGVHYAIGNGRIFFDGRYQLGLSNLDDTGEGDYCMKNRGFGFALGYLMPINPTK